MYSIKNYIMADSIDSAYEELMKNRSNTLLGGCGWLKMSKKNIHTAIDLSNLNLNQIEETDTQFKIGCMTTLRQIELSDSLNRFYDGILAKSVRNIVGVQFRNCATIGASIFSRYGFSDILTALLSLNAYVELYKGGIVPIAEFVSMKMQKDLLLNIIIEKQELKASYLSFRNTATDFPVLAVAVSNYNGDWKISVGARPEKAALAVKSMSMLSSKSITQEDIKQVSESVAEELSFGTNIRATKDYRKHLAKVLVTRAMNEIL